MWTTVWDAFPNPAAGVTVAQMAVAFLVTGQTVAQAVSVSDPTTEQRGVEITRTYSDNVLTPGEEFTVRYDFNNPKSADRYLHYFQDKPPAGLTFLGMDYTSTSGGPTRVWRSGPAAGDWNDPSPWDGYPSQPSVGSGGVLVDWRSGGTCAGAACDLALVHWYSGSKKPTLVFRYRVNDDTMPGTLPAWNADMYFEFFGGGSYAGTAGRLTVEKRETTTSVVAASSNPGTVGNPIELSATVTGGVAVVPVEFRDGDDILCTGHLGANGAVSCDWENPAVGTADVKAFYPGDARTVGSESPSVTTVTVNPIGVTDLSVSPVDPTSEQEVTVSGTATPGASVTVSGPGGKECRVGADALTGAFECSLGALPVGTHTLSVVAALNGVDSDPATVSVTVTEAPDETAPGAPTDVSLSSPVAPGGEVTVAGSAEPGSTITVSIGGVDQQCSPATVAADGSFSCAFDAPDAEGDYTVSVSASNEAGSSPAVTETLTVEEPVPTDPSVTITPNPPVAGEETEIEVIGDEGDEVVVTIDGEEVCRKTIGADGTVTCTWTPGEPGETEIDIVVGENDPIVITVDVEPADDTGTIPGGSLGGLLGGSLGGDNGSGSLGSLGSSGLSWFKGSTATGTGSGGSLDQSGSWGQVG